MKVQGRDLVWIGKSVEVPLIGSIAFGLIDRGTNIVQVRPISICPLSCIFCSTDAGPKSRWRRAEYIVEPDVLIEWFKALAKLKGKHIEAHIDTVGEPLTYGKRLIDLVQNLKSLREVEIVSMQTHASILTEKLADDLNSAGLDRINLSIDTLDPYKARYLQGTSWYNVEKVKEVAEYIVSNTNTDVMLTPLYLPGLNDEDLDDIIEWGKRIGIGKRFPPFGIQYFMKHKHGRTPKEVKPIGKREFIKKLRELEAKHKVKLILGREDFNIIPMKSAKVLFKVGEKVTIRIVAPGWLKNEWIGIPVGRFEDSRVITLIDKDGLLEEGLKVKALIISNKHNIYLARPLL